ncbi:MAG: hypothetical protein WD715_05930 [Dongiaceae bacterium]
MNDGLPSFLAGPGDIAVPRDDEGPIFAAPWQAQSFASVVALVRAGHCRWDDFKILLIDEIAKAPLRDYWESWRRAAERLADRIARISQDEIAARAVVVADELAHRRAAQRRYETLEAVKAGT